jgi:hypothetical protein
MGQTWTSESENPNYVRGNSLGTVWEAQLKSDSILASSGRTWRLGVYRLASERTAGFCLQGDPLCR